LIFFAPPGVGVTEENQVALRSSVKLRIF